MSQHGTSAPMLKWLQVLSWHRSTMADVSKFVMRVERVSDTDEDIVHRMTDWWVFVLFCYQRTTYRASLGQLVAVS